MGVNRQKKSKEAKFYWTRKGFLIRYPEKSDVVIPWYRLVTGNGESPCGVPHTHDVAREFIEGFPSDDSSAGTKWRFPGWA